MERNNYQSAWAIYVGVLAATSVVLYIDYSFLIHRDFGPGTDNSIVSYIFNLFKGYNTYKVRVFYILLLCCSILMPKNPLNKRGGILVIIYVAVVAFIASIFFIYVHKLPFVKFSYPVLYIISTLSIFFLCVKIADILSFGRKRLKDDYGFKIEKELIKTDSSFNFKVEYENGETGYVNILNPEMGISLVGAGGAGKTFSVIQPAILQSVEKNFCVILHDYKFEELTSYLYSCLEHLGSNRPLWVLNFTDMRKSHQINILHNIKTIQDARSFATLFYKLLTQEPGSNKPEDPFWANSTPSIIAAIIWYLKKNHPGHLSLPHVISMGLYDPEKLIERLRTDEDCELMLRFFISVMEKKAGNTLGSLSASLALPLQKLVSREYFWVLCRNSTMEIDGKQYTITLDVNDPLNACHLSIGNYNIDRDVLAPILSSLLNRATKEINRENKLRTLVCIEEASTVDIPDIKEVSNQGRSNNLIALMCFQAKSQLVSQKGQSYADDVFASLSNQIVGQMNDAKAIKDIVEIFGKQDKVQENVSYNQSSGTSTSQSAGESYSLQERNLVKSSDILKLERGEFFFKLATGEKDKRLMKARIVPENIESKMLPVFVEFPRVLFTLELEAEYYTLKKEIKNSIKNGVVIIPQSEMDILQTRFKEIDELKKKDENPILDMNYKNILRQAKSILEGTL